MRSDPKSSEFVGIVVEADRLRDLDRSRHLEWLVTNGRGGFAMGTAPGILTRRYHGLLVAAVKPPVDRWVLLAKLEATVVGRAGRIDLSCNDFPAAVHPMGHEWLTSFAPSPLPTWRWRLPDGTVIEQTVFMELGRDTTYIQFRLVDGPSQVEFEVRPLCTSRPMHELLERRDLGEPQIRDADGRFSVCWTGRPALNLATNGTFKPLPDWYYQFALHAEAARGQPDRQDLFMPGPIRHELRRGDATGLIVAASTEPIDWQDWAAVRDRAIRRRTVVPLPESVRDPLARALARATADFIVDRGDGKTIIAGYPWFGDWGRDTFISLPGLCLVTGRFDEARQIIGAFADHVREGLVPNRFPDSGEQPEYNTVDASLWYIHAIDRYLAYSGDWPFVAERMWRVIQDILGAYAARTRHGIRAGPDGLLAAGEPGVQLTWMDAKIGDWVVTPRIGKPVEINALWYNALRIAASLAKRRDDRAAGRRWTELAEQVRAAFNSRCWNAESRYCYDVVDVDHVSGRLDASLRPNQLLAIGLTHPVLDSSRWIDVVRIVRERLWTPIGLRTLDPNDPNYQPRYAGDMRSRDAAYHQGTVWPWLLGPFITAWVRANGGRDAARDEARTLLAGLKQHLAEAGLESVSEIAEGRVPHRPDGCPFQAWSVAEPLRALVEDVLGRAPRG